MTEFLEVLKYVLPSLIVLATCYIVLSKMLKREEIKQKNEILLGNQKLVTPIRLQAYERAILFLERISPQALVVRASQQGSSVRSLQMAILQMLRNEFEHNLSQQVYMTNEAWDQLVAAKESIVQLVNVAASRFSPDEPASSLSLAIIEMNMSVEESPIKKAVNFIKAETHHFLDNKPLYY